MTRRPAYRERFPVALTACLRHSYRAPAVEIVGRDGTAAEHLGRRPLKHYLTAVTSRARAYVNHIVGLKHHLLVMLNHNHRIRRVTQPLQRVDKAEIVTLVKTYRRLVKYIQHIDKLRPQLRGKTYALALSARQCRRRAVKRQIVKPHINKKTQSGAYLLKYLGRYDAVRRTQILLGSVHPLEQIGDIHAAQIGDILVVYKEMQCLAVQPVSFAFHFFDCESSSSALSVSIYFTIPS